MQRAFYDGSRERTLASVSSLSRACGAAPVMGASARSSTGSSEDLTGSLPRASKDLMTAGAGGEARTVCMQSGWYSMVLRAFSPDTYAACEIVPKSPRARPPDLNGRRFIPLRSSEIMALPGSSEIMALPGSCV